MTIPLRPPDRGIVYTFYSFKGGVGRSMALANVAAVLAKWGRRVLVIDWDLEAPGLEKFFVGSAPNPIEERAKRAGIVDLILAHSLGAPLHWRNAVMELPIGSAEVHVSLISAGRSGPDYGKRLQQIDFERLFTEKQLGTYIEELRNEWLAEYDFVLVDSRTGVTDIGGICTVQLADVLVLLFTTTETSVEGIKDIVERARKRQQLLPVDRQRLLGVPVPARDESRTEYQKAAEWKARFGEAFKDLFADWLPSGVTAHDAIEILRIPYVPYWSFGEKLPAIEETTTDPSSIGHAYELLARLLDSRLDWHQAMEGELPPQPPAEPRTSLDEAWLSKHRSSALKGLAKAGVRGFMEIHHGCLSILGKRSQAELLKLAKQIAILTFGWPIGVVLDTDQSPKPVNDGIVAQISHESSYDYWALRNNGDFYALMSLFEDERTSDAIYVNTRIVRVTETLMRCNSLYRAFGADSGSTIHVRIRHGGIINRTLTSAGMPRQIWATKNTTEDVVDTGVSFRLSDVNRSMVELVKEICAPLFILFDFAEIRHEQYEKIVSSFLSGKVM